MRRSKIGVALGSTIFATLLGLSGAAYAEPVELVSVWQFDEDAEEFASGVVRDSVDGNDGAVTNATSTTVPNAIFGRGLDLNGTSAQVTVGNSANLDFAGAYTLEAWMNSDDTALGNVYRPIFVRGADDGATDENDIEVYIQANTKGLIVCHDRVGANCADAVGFDDPPLGGWFHLAVTFDGTDIRAYYDGVLAGIVQGNTAMPAPSASGKDWLFGKVNHDSFDAFGTGRTQYFDGRMDEARFWDSALTDGEVEASHVLALIAAFGGVNMGSAKPGAEVVTTEGVLTFFIASVYDTPTLSTDVNVCISPDVTVDDVLIEISPTNAFTLRNWTPRQSGSSWNEADSDDSVANFVFLIDVCATVEDVDFAATKRSKTLHLDLNLVDTDIDAPLTGGDGVIVDSIGVNIQKNPLGG